MNEREIELQKKIKLKHKRTNKEVNTVIDDLSYIDIRSNKEVLCGVSMIRVSKLKKQMYEIEQHKFPTFQVTTSGLLKILFTCYQREDLFCNNVSEPHVDLRDQI